MIGYEIKSWEIRQIVRILRDLEFCDASTIRGLNAIRNDYQFVSIVGDKIGEQFCFGAECFRKVVGPHQCILQASVRQPSDYDKLRERTLKIVNKEDD